MYQIVKLCEGKEKYSVSCKVQDGNERWYEQDIRTAIMSLIKAAKVYNNADITENDITFYQQKKVLIPKYEYVKVVPSEI